MDQASKDKAQTKGKLIAAVGQLLATEGPAALGINRIARQAGVNKKLIYRYFGGKDRLIESYITENDYWLIQAQAITDLQQPSQTELQHQLTELLQNQFRYFLSHPNMQDLILWELNTKSLMKSIHLAREHIGQALFEKIDSHIPQNNLRAISALLVGGIYYSILHTRHNEHKFCDLQLNEASDQQAILNAITQIIEWAFNHIGAGIQIGRHYPITANKDHR